MKALFFIKVEIKIKVENLLNLNLRLNLRLSLNLRLRLRLSLSLNSHSPVSLRYHTSLVDTLAARVYNCLDLRAVPYSDILDWHYR